MDFSFLMHELTPLKKTNKLEILNVLLSAVSSHTSPFSGSYIPILEQEQASGKPFVPPLAACLLAAECWCFVLSLLSSPPADPPTNPCRLWNKNSRTKRHVSSCARHGTGCGCQSGHSLKSYSDFHRRLF